MVSSDDDPRAATDGDASLEEALGNVTYGAAISVVGMLLHRILGVVTAGLLTTGLGPGPYGLYALARRFHNLLQAFTSGARVCIDRYLSPAPTRAEEEHVFAFALTVGGVLGLVFAAALYFVAPHITSFTGKPPSFTPIIRAASAGLPFGVVVFLIATAFRSRGEIGFQNLLLRLFVPSTGLVAGVVTIAFGLGAVLATATVAALTACLAIGSFIWFIWHTGYRPRNPLADRDKSTTMARFTAPVLLSAVLGHIQYGGYYAVAAYFVSPTAAGMLAIASLLGVFVRLPLDAFNQIVPQAASSLHDNGSNETLIQLHSVTSRLVLLVSVPIATYVVAYRRPILTVFDSVYLQYAHVVPIVASMQIVATGVGSVGILLSMTDRQDEHLLYNVFVTAVMVVSSVGLAHLYGLVGIAVAMFLTLTTNNVGQLAILNRLEGFQPFTRAHLVPFAAAGVAGVAFQLVSTALSGVPLLVIGGGVGLGGYVVAVQWIGLQDIDRRVIRGLLSS